MKKWKKTRRQKLKRNNKQKSRISLDFSDEMLVGLQQQAHDMMMSVGNYVSYLMKKIDKKFLDDMYKIDSNDMKKDC